MACVRLLDMLVTVLAIAASCQWAAGAVVDDQFSTLQEGDCLPADVSSLGSAECQKEADHTQELLCIASSVGISSDHGYDQTAGEAYVDQLSSDQEWSARQKQRLTNCSSMVLGQVPGDREGAFVLACWHQLLLSECHRQRMAAQVALVDPQNARELTEAVADLAEGPCFDVGLQYAAELGVKWAACASESRLNMSILQAAAHFYTLFSQGEDIPAATAENNARTLEHLGRLNDTALCYAQATGEVTADGDVNYDLIHEATRNAAGAERLKVVDRAFVEYCRDQSPDGIGTFYACFNRQKPFACAVLKSYDIALGRSASSGGVAATTAAPAAAGIIASILGSIF